MGYYHNFKPRRTVTKREVLFSIVIVFIMVTIGYFISEAISNHVAEKNEFYYKAVKINNDKEQFTYGMKTNIGNALIYGNIKAINPVAIPELNKKYLSINKITERYTKHTRQVRHKTSSGHVYYTTEVYYTWDYHSRDFKSVDNIYFLNIKFPIEKIDFNNVQTLDLNNKTVSKGYVKSIKYNYIYEDNGWESVGDLRYYYEVVPVEFKGSILAKLKDNTILNAFDAKSKIDFIDGKNIKEVIKYVQHSEEFAIHLFWFFWILFIIGTVVAFVMIENNWLEDRKE